jgi:hypothetical protein
MMFTSEGAEQARIGLLRSAPSLGSSPRRYGGIGPP